MSEFSKKYREFFQESDAGQELMKVLDSVVQNEYTEASRLDDMQASYAHIQRAKGAQMTIDRINSMMMEVKKPIRAYR